VAGNEHLAVEWSNHCQSHGFLVAAIRYPSVPRGLARLRISLSANHRDEDMSRLEEALATVPAQGA
jgi:8-amino-7-oxononanoate synthase